MARQAPGGNRHRADGQTSNWPYPGCPIASAACRQRPRCCYFASRLPGTEWFMESINAAGHANPTSPVIGTSIRRTLRDRARVRASCRLNVDGARYACWALPRRCSAADGEGCQRNHGSIRPSSLTASASLRRLLAGCRRSTRCNADPVGNVSDDVKWRPRRYDPMPPASLRERFAGQSGVNARVWTLRLNDVGSSDTGSLSSATLLQYVDDAIFRHDSEIGE